MEWRMSEQRDIDLIEELISHGSELGWLEFKVNNSDPKTIGILCSAISNGARIAGRDSGYVLWGVDDATHQIIGTVFQPHAEKISNQDFQFWLAAKLKPSLAVNFKIIQHSKGRVVLLEIPAAMTVPTSFDNIAYIRIGSATPRLADHTDFHTRLLESMRPYMWEHGAAKQYLTGDEVLSLLDYASYFRFIKQPLPDNRSGIFEKLSSDQLIVKDVADKWNITNLGAILFAVDLNEFGSALARKGVRVVVYGDKNKASPVTHRHDSVKGYANALENLTEFINNVLPDNEHIGDALREQHRLFPRLAIRELVANALIHQDMTVTGAGPQIEIFKDRIEITNPGKPLMQPDRMIDLPPRSRNEMMASLMRRMGFCEEQGSGLDKVIEVVEVFQLPPPLLREADSFMQVILYGPRTFANMTPDERIRACYQHAILKWLSGDRMKNSTLCGRFGIEKRNAAQATKVIALAQKLGLIKPADPEHPRAGYVPRWA
jgi:ATP-dependent DNA helicase RecG